jgi:peptide/nickel transport system substrate-binding protein
MVLSNLWGGEQIMAKKIVWLVVSCLILLSLVLTSCGTKEEETKVTEEGGQVVTTKEEVQEGEVTEEEGLLPPEVPKYGGMGIWVAGSSSHFDPLNFLHMYCQTVYFTQEELLTGDWKKGPAGTDETSLMYGTGGRIELMEGRLAESWESPDDETIIFHIRPGIHWWNKAPANGRELTADDVVWTMNQAFTNTGCYFYVNFTSVGLNPTSIKALDKYTVEVKLPPTSPAGFMLFELGDRLYQCCPEPYEAGLDMDDWRNAIGTASWMLTDYVAASSSTYKKNPNYWQYDPIHPENQLPYMDGIKILFITDASTSLAAFRTGKIDYLLGVNWEDKDSLISQNPELKYVNRYSMMYMVPCGRMDKPELPFADIRVRQALNIAINKQELVDSYYGGNADLLGYPVNKLPEFSPYYIPLEEQPEAVQELFTYNPEKAKQLLAEAGYPNGFKTNIICAQSNVDYLSIIREYLLAVGIDMELKPMEQGQYSSMAFGRTYEQMVYGMTRTDIPYMLFDLRKEQMFNPSGFEDERTREAWAEMSKVLGKNDAEVARIMRDIGTYALESAWGIWLPSPYTYAMWWPWFQNYHGEWDMGYACQERAWTYIWLDQDLKRSMGY